MSNSVGTVAFATGVIILGTLSACTSSTGFETATEGGDQRFVTDVEQADYHLLMAEFALEQQRFEDAAREYRLAAQLSDKAEVASRAALVATELGMREEALASSRRWVTLAPSDPEARRYLIRALIQTDRVDETIHHSFKFLELQETNPEGRHLDLLSMLLDSPKAESATQVMEAVAEQYGQSSRAQYALATLALQSRNEELALKSARRARRIDSDWLPAALVYSRALIASGQVEEGLDQARMLAEDTGAVAARLEYALLLLGADRNDDAKTELEAVLAEQPRTSIALKTLGMLELQEGNLDAARNRFTELLSTGRDIHDAFYYLAWIAEQQEDHPRALRLYARVNTGPNAAAAHIRSSRILYRLGSGEAALQVLAEFALNNPSVASQMIAAQGELLSDMGRTDEALTLYIDHLAQNPKDDTIRYSKAYLYERLDRVDEAVSDLRGILKDNPDDPMALNALGYTLTDRTGRHREAYKLIKRALELDPENAAIIDSMGWVEFRLGRYENALVHLQRAYERQKDPEIASHLGEVLYVLGRPEEARSVWNEAAQANPDNRHIIKVLERFPE